MVDMYEEKGKRQCNGKKCKDGEECGTLSLGDRPGQLRGWNVPEKYVAYSWRTGNKALSLSPPLLPSLSLHLEFSCLSFTAFSVSSPHYVCFLLSPILLAFGYSFLFIFLQFKSIHFFFYFHAWETRTAWCCCTTQTGSGGM